MEKYEIHLFLYSVRTPQLGLLNFIEKHRKLSGLRVLWDVGCRTWCGEKPIFDGITVGDSNCETTAAKRYKKTKT